MQQLDIFTPTARTEDPETSRCAAEIASQGAETNRWIALKALVAASPGGLTDFELEAKTGIAQTSIGVRRGELVKQGLVEGKWVETGRGPKWIARPAPSGSPSRVWYATKAGRLKVWGTEGW